MQDILVGNQNGKVYNNYLFFVYSFRIIREYLRQSFDEYELKILVLYYVLVCLDKNVLWSKLGKMGLFVQDFTVQFSQNLIHFSIISYSCLNRIDGYIYFPYKYQCSINYYIYTIARLRQSGCSLQWWFSPQFRYSIRSYYWKDTNYSRCSRYSLSCFVYHSVPYFYSLDSFH